MPRYLAVCFTALALLAGCGHPPEQVAYTGAIPAAPTTTVATTTLPPPTTTTAPARPRVRAAAATPAAPARLASRCDSQLADLIAVHFPPEQTGRACAVMLCESGGNPTATNPRSSASGLWQFLDSTWDGLDGRPPAGPAGYAGVARAMYAPPDVQTAAAARLWASSGWAPWSCA